MADKWAGVIYILTNPAFEDYVKIGFATDLEQRLKSLNSNPGVPYSFRAYAVYHVTTKLTDKKLHNMIDKLNPDLRTVENFDGKTRKKEFYAMSPEDAYSLLESIAAISGTTDRLQRMKPEGHEVMDEKNAEEDRVAAHERKSPFSFTKCGIPAGAVICFKEDPKYKATVLDDKHVLYDGITYTTTGLTRELMKTEKGVDKYFWHGPIHWTYKGKLLNDIRLEREKKGTYK